MFWEVGCWGRVEAGLVEGFGLLVEWGVIGGRGGRRWGGREGCEEFGEWNAGEKGCIEDEAFEGSGDWKGGVDYEGGLGDGTLSVDGVSMCL